VHSQKEAIAMFKNAPLPVLVVVVVAGTAAVAWLLHVTGSDAGPRGDIAVIPSRLTYDEARAKLLRNSRWHFTDSPSPVCCWVTRQPRLARDLEDAILVHDRDDPTHSRRGIVRVQPVRGPATTIALDENDTSYWRVIGNVHLSGDPALVREVAAFLLVDTES
jgi:hypothetical protein